LLFWGESDLELSQLRLGSRQVISLKLVVQLRRHRGHVVGEAIH
jgi:hypothetical protein